MTEATPPPAVARLSPPAFTGLLTIARKEFVLLLRDPALIVLLFVAPLALILFLSDAVGGGIADAGRRPVDYVVTDATEGRRLTPVLGAPAAVVAADEAMRMVERGDAEAVVVRIGGATRVIVGAGADPTVAGALLVKLAAADTEVVDTQGRPYTASRSAKEQSIPGFALMFAFFGAGFTGQAFFREHDWGTWNRTLSLPLSKGGILLGKALPVGALVFLQGLLLVVGGALAFGLPVRSPLLLVGTLALVGLVACALGMLLISLVRSSLQVAQLTNLIVLFLGALGGAIAPLAVMPGWAQSVAPLTPHYWAMRLLQGAMRGPAPTALRDGLVLASFALAFGLLGRWRTRFLRTVTA